MAGATGPEWPLRRGAALPTILAMLILSYDLPAPAPSAATRIPDRPRRVTLCADDRSAALGWQAELRGEGLSVELCDAVREGADAHVLFVTTGLSSVLPLLREHRATWPQMPLLVACRGLRELDQVLALEMGADDALDSSVSAPVVAARLRALWRRQLRLTSALDVPPPQELRFGKLRLLLRERRVLLAEQTVPLSEGEFEVLWLLASHAGRAVSRRDILRRVRGLDDHPTDRSIDSRVYRIRAKLGDRPGAAPHIRTVRNHGYAFSPVGW